METVKLVDLADERSMIEGKHYVDKVILGPGVMAPLADVTITNCIFGGDPNSLFIELPEDRPVIGFIGVRATTFDRCQFQNVGIAGTPESIAVFRRGFGLK